MKRGELGLTVIVFVAAAFRMSALTRESLWLDEIATVDFVARHTPFEIIRATFAIDFHPFAYYLLLDVWTMVFGVSDAVCRLFSALLGIVSVALTYRLAQTATRSTSTALLAATFVAVNPTHIWYSQECRMYALVVLAWTLCIDSLFRVLTHFSARRMLAFLAAFCLFAYAHGSVGFIVLPFLVGAVLICPVLRPERTPPELGPVTTSPRRRLIMVGLLTVVYAPWMFRLVGLERGVKTLGTLGIKDAARLVEWLFLFEHSPPLVVRAAFWIALVVAMIVLPAVSRRGDSARVCLLSSSVVVPLVTTCALSLAVPLYQRRNLVLLLVPLAVVAGHAASTALRRVLRSRSWAVRYGLGVVTLLTIAGGTLYSARLSAWDLRTAPQKEDWRAATRYLLANADRDDVIAFFAGFTEPCFRFYAARTGSEADRSSGPYPGSELSTVGIERDSEAFPRSVADLISTLADREARSLWVVYSHAPDAERLENVLVDESGMGRVSSRSFHHILIVSYSLDDTGT